RPDRSWDSVPTANNLAAMLLHPNRYPIPEKGSLFLFPPSGVAPFVAQIDPERQEKAPGVERLLSQDQDATSENRNTSLASCLHFRFPGGKAGMPREGRCRSLLPRPPGQTLSNMVPPCRDRAIS